MKKFIVLFSLTLFAAGTLSAQGRKSKGGAATPLKASVVQVADRRTTSFFSQLSIRLELDDVKASEVAAVKVRVTKAVDDTGRDLVDTEKNEPRFEPTGGPMSTGGDDDRPASVEVTLKNPDREAVVVTEVVGEVELYMPGKDRDAVAVIPNFQSLGGKPISNRALKASGVQISVIGPAQLEAAKQKAMQAKREEAKAEGSDEEMIAWQVSNVEQSFLTPEPGEIVLMIKDPNSRIHELGFVPPSGEAQRAFTQDRDGMTVISTYGEPAQPDWGLKVSLRTPKTMKKYALALKDVKLP